MNQNLKILIVDDHPAVRVAVKYILSSSGYKYLTQAATGVDAINACGKIDFDIVIVDLDLPLLDGLEVVKRIKKMKPNTRVLILSAMVTDLYVARCYAAGVNGFMQKNEDIENLPLVVSNIINGFSYFPSLSGLDRQRIEMSDSEINIASCLSDRELTVFNKLVSGMTNLDIARELFLSNKTISTYKARVFQKLGVSNIAELIELSKTIKG